HGAIVGSQRRPSLPRGTRAGSAVRIPPVSRMGSIPDARQASLSLRRRHTSRRRYYRRAGGECEPRNYQRFEIEAWILKGRISRMTSIGASVVFVILVTLMFRLITIVNAVAVVNATTAGFAYLIVILLVAAYWGTAESVIASVAATVCFNYFFLPPVGT